MTSDCKNLNVFSNEWIKQYCLKFQNSEIIFLEKASERFELDSDSSGLTLSLDSYLQELGSITPAELAQQYGHNDIAKIILKSAKQDNVDLPCPPIHSDVMIKSDYQPDLLKGIPIWNWNIQTGPVVLLQQEVPRKWGLPRKVNLVLLAYFPFFSKACGKVELFVLVKYMGGICKTRSWSLLWTI